MQGLFAAGLQNCILVYYASWLSAIKSLSKTHMSRKEMQGVPYHPKNDKSKSDPSSAEVGNTCSSVKCL